MRVRLLDCELVEPVLIEEEVPTGGHARISDWPDYAPNPVAFELMSAECRPVDVGTVGNTAAIGGA